MRHGHPSRMFQLCPGDTPISSPLFVLFYFLMSVGDWTEWIILTFRQDKTVKTFRAVSWAGRSGPYRADISRAAARPLKLKKSTSRVTARLFEVSQDWPRPDPSSHIFKWSRPGLARPGSAHQFWKVSAQPVPARPGSGKPHMTSPGRFTLNQPVHTCVFFTSNRSLKQNSVFAKSTHVHTYRPGSTWIPPRHFCVGRYTFLFLWNKIYSRRKIRNKKPLWSPRQGLNEHVC